MTVRFAINVNFCKRLYGYPTGDSIVTKTRKPGFVYVEHHALFTVTFPCLVTRTFESKFLSGMHFKELLSWILN